MSGLRSLGWVVALTIIMLLICWISLGVGKFFYSKISTWRWAPDRQALWSIYLSIWCVVFLIYNLLLHAIRKIEKKNIYALAIALLLWIIPLLFFTKAIDIRPMSILAIHLAALPPLAMRYWLFFQKGH